MVRERTLEAPRHPGPRAQPRDPLGEQLGPRAQLRDPLVEQLGPEMMETLQGSPPPGRGSPRRNDLPPSFIPGVPLDLPLNSPRSRCPSPSNGPSVPLERHLPSPRARPPVPAKNGCGLLQGGRAGRGDLRA